MYETPEEKKPSMRRWIILGAILAVAGPVRVGELCEENVDGANLLPEPV